LLIDVVNGLASAICMGPMRTIIQTETDEKMAGRVFGQARRNTSVDAARNAA
jgi:DHA3 family macrolide efflux protein-like MFS transporter